MSQPVVTVALVQSSPIFNDLPASMEKCVDHISQAARQKAQIVAFGESWLAGYPAWLDHCPNAALWDHDPTKDVYARMRQNSVAVPGRETEILQRAACENEISIVMGINERVQSGVGSGTLYNSLLTFDEKGLLVNHHRKLIPTYTERLVWGQGDGAGLKAVETAGGRVGSLICWEHWMPLARQAMHDSGEQIHVSVYPTVHEAHQIASRHYAFEGRCFVLAVGSILDVADLPRELATGIDLEVTSKKLLLRGGSCVVGPDGGFVVEPIFDEEKIIVAELDFRQIDREKMTLDVSGHYSRPDVFNFTVNSGARRKTIDKQDGCGA
ncbi:MAG: carbon-nitrogen hydrolase family protein [Pyrinomonadaceae bacterium]